MAAALLSLALSLALLAAGGRACSLPPRGCTAGSCNLLDSNGFGKSPPYFNGATNSGNKLIGKYYGLWNEAAGNKTAVSSQFGGPIINFEVVKVQISTQERSPEEVDSSIPLIVLFCTPHTATHRGVIPGAG